MKKIEIPDNKKYDIIILGGGASGMIAAITSGSFFAQKNITAKIAIIERHNKLGRKLLATGNGHCNLSNINIEKASVSEHYYSEFPSLYESVIASFPPSRTVDFFESIGILCHTKEDGKIYPFCEQAYSVVEALEQKMKLLGVDILLDSEVTGLTGLQDDGFRVDFADESIYAKKIIVAAGGKASPALSSDGLGYSLLSRFSHTCTELFPAIVQLKTETDFIAPLAGTKWEVGVNLIRVFCDKNHEERIETLRKETGELLFTKYGISGPPVLQLSRHIQKTPLNERNSKRDETYFAVIDFMNEFDASQLVDLLAKRIESFAARPIRHLLIGILPFKIAGAMIRKNFPSRENQCISTISPSDLAVLVTQMKRFPLRITGTTGWAEAQITAGGIRCDEIDGKTMESHFCNGLYIAGEILDVDGDCGGYNLQFAWASGHAAGENAAMAIYKERNTK
ncbi:MAG: BaiN/RdsA family NAD(P)/FAD-dependent oxidoreductase [Saccharofermentanales bacterium]